MNYKLKHQLKGRDASTYTQAARYHKVSWLLLARPTALLMIKPSDSNVCGKFQAPVVEVAGPQRYFVYKHHYSMDDKSLLSSSVSLQRSRQENGEKKNGATLFFLSL